MKFELQWGGYYSSQDKDGKFSVFRLLDFNINTYHAAFYTETFENIPTKEEVLKLSPFLEHAPIDSKALLNEKELSLICGKELEIVDLTGYSYYLTRGEEENEELKEFLDSVVSFSKNPPMTLLLSIENEKLDIKELVE